LVILMVICLTILATASSQVDCTQTSTGNIPINDLGTGFFMGYQGGLYPDGQNAMPATHKNAGTQAVKCIKPFNAAG
ncbi:MAG: hypothetical protein ACHQFW_11065, partial [Chitinophagales bacterium]